MATILNFSEALSLALHTMALLASRRDQVCSNRRIAERLAVSEAHLSKVLQRLHRTGLVHSVRGPRGGFSLARRGEEIALLEVYEAIEGPLEPATCLFGEPVCNGDGCILGDCLHLATRAVRTRLEKTSLADVADVFNHREGRA